MTNLELVFGTTGQWPFQIVNRDGTLPIAGQYLASDIITAKAWPGRSKGSIFNPTVAWANSGTGADTGLIVMSITAAQCATLNVSEVYQVQIFVTRGSADPVCVEWATLKILPSAGSSTSLTLTYATYSDLEFYCPWLDETHDVLTDEAGYYPYLLRARNWLDRIIVSRARPLAYIYNIFTPLTPWGPVEAPNYIIQGYLKANYLLLRDVTIEIVARRALYQIAEKMVSNALTDVWISRSKYMRRSADNLLVTYNCEISISSAPSVRVNDNQGGGAQALVVIDPIAGVVTNVFPIVLGVNYLAPTVDFIGGTGSGAAATANVVGGQVPTYTVTNPGVGYFQKQTPDISFNLGMVSMR